jgi:ATP synthase protein I
MVKMRVSNQFFLQAYLIIGLQISILLLSTVMCRFYYGQRTATSVALGGIAVILPTLYFAFKLFYKIQQKDSKTQLYHFYAGQTVKLLLSVGLSLIMLITLHAALIPFLMGFLLTQSSIFLLPFLQIMLRIVSFRP